ncbi:TetR/AcrR family transcriptional regulator [Clostridium sp. JN-1]|uniref:TetR/AcrR family transcriptional regulator n=1 Tax=Clostridium sp. JN-1 TaxID=2483110 RepID=UPI000F0BB41C|nr:TetR/AcrR family transcriptional regulator [Clostridium sp. JN-1]
MGKRELIIKAMEQLLMEDKGASCSVSDIAQKAGIGKGSIYYYYKSKEELFDAVVDYIYSRKINQYKEVITKDKLNALEKLEFIFKSYRNSAVDSSIDLYLHQQQNAAIHQKSLAKILNLLSPIIADIFNQGINEKLFICEKPGETAEIFISTFCFLFDHGIFEWTAEQIEKKAKALAYLFEKGLSAPEGSFKFLYS